MLSSSSDSGPLKVEFVSTVSSKILLKIFLLSIFPVGEMDFS